MTIEVTVHSRSRKKGTTEGKLRNTDDICDDIYVGSIMPLKMVMLNHMIMMKQRTKYNKEM